MATDISTFTDEQKQLFNRANALGSGVDVIDSSSLEPTPGLTLPEAPPQDDLGAVNTGLDALFQTSPLETQQQDLSTELLKLTQDLQGRDESQFLAEQEAGIPEQRKREQELLSEFQSLGLESQAIPLQVQEESVGRGRTIGGIRPIEAGRLRQNTIKRLGIAAEALAVQGSLRLAQEQVNRKVDLEFKPIEDRLQILQTAYALNKDALERYDKKEAQRVGILLDERARLLQNQKENARLIDNLTLEAVSNSANPAPPEVLRQVQSAQTPQEALLYLAPYLSDPFEVEERLADLAYKNAQIAYVNSQRDKIEWETQDLIDSMQGVGASGPKTATQFAAAGYGRRLLQSSSVIEELTGSVNVATGQFESTGRFTGTFSRLPTLEGLKSDDRKRLEQAERNFINSVLRRESGAAIAESEFENARKQYFPQRGDGPAVLAQKKANRDLVINNFMQEAQLKPSSAFGTPIYKLGNKIYVQGEDGLYYEQ